MTNRETLKLITELRDDWEDDIQYCHSEISRDEMRGRVEIADNCIQALEKQEPKKPFRPYEDIDLNQCPICKDPLYIFSSIYCERCGQAIDWGGDDER